MSERLFPLEFLNFLNTEKGIARDNQIASSASDDDENLWEDQSEFDFQSGKLALISSIEKEIQRLQIAKH